MFNRKNTNGKVLLFVILLFMCGLFSANASEEEWDWGDDITASGFSWGYITPDYPMYYVDSSNYVRKKIVKAYVVEDHYYDSTHCYTTASHGIPHVHFEYELGNGGLPSKSQVNTYWDARFRCPEICTYSPDTASTKQNCHAFAFDIAFDGTYEYWVNNEGPVFTDDAHTVGTIQSFDVIHYGNGDPGKTHSTFYDSIEGTELLAWKWAYSQIYIITDPVPNCYSTPKYLGNVYYNPDDNSQPTHTLSYNISHWTWSETGAGDYCAPDTYVYRKN